MHYEVGAVHNILLFVRVQIYIVEVEEIPEMIPILKDQNSSKSSQLKDSPKELLR